MSVGEFAKSLCWKQMKDVGRKGMVLQSSVLI